MNNPFQLVKRAVIISTTIFLCHCGPLPDIVTTEKKADEAHSADEVRQVTVDQPFLMSGDFIRESEKKPAFEINLGEKNSNKDASVQSASVSGKTATTASSQPETAAPAPSLAAYPEGMPIKVGMVVDQNNISPQIAGYFLSALPRSTDGLPVLVGNQNHVDEIVARTPCLKNKDLLCLSNALSIYPGVRMLMLVEDAQFPDKIPGAIAAKMTIVDTGLPFRYPVIELKVPVKRSQDINAAVSDLLRSALAFASEKSSILPWHCRSFSGDKKEWYLSAGKQSGLKTGDRLNIVGGGKVVPSPTGFPAGWIPGPVKGVLKITQFFGDDFATGICIQGQGPAPGDLLIKPAP